MDKERQIPLQQLIERDEQGNLVYTFEGFKENRYNFRLFRLEWLQENRTFLLPYYKKAVEENPELYDRILFFKKEIVDPAVDKLDSVVNSEEYLKGSREKKQELARKLKLSEECQKMETTREERSKADYEWYRLLKKYGAEENQMDILPFPSSESEIAKITIVMKDRFKS